MQYWTAPEIWKGSTCIIIGGGSSLVGFDFNSLRGIRTIGCNDAYMLGADICDVCFFVDFQWYTIHKRTLPDGKPGLDEYGGLKVTFVKNLVGNTDGVRVLERDMTGLCCAPRLGWYASSGNSAINLAMIFGCSNIVLLGFDNSLGKNQEHNWHVNYRDEEEKKQKKFIKYNVLVYDRFMKQLCRLERDRNNHHKYSNVKIYNAGPLFNLHNLFPHISLNDVLSGNIE